MATCIRRVGSFRHFSVTAIYHMASLRSESPYGTIVQGPDNYPFGAGPLGSQNFTIGKTAVFPFPGPYYANLFRAGQSFVIPHFSGTPRAVTLTVPYTIEDQTLETCSIHAYLSSTDDSAYATTTWQNNLNTFIGDCTSGAPIAFPWNDAMKGTNISIVLGQSFELSGTGANPPDALTGVGNESYANQTILSGNLKFAVLAFS